jgi:aryl-alcohol dehydrogenase-like predicted oxidoreductase
MQYVNLPGTSVKVSRMCLGTMMFGDQTSEADSLSIMDCALEQGVNFWDTADSYTKGECEKIVGKGLKGRRERIILASKIFNQMTDDMNNRGLSRRHIIAGIDASLKRLNTDYIDLIYMHNPDYDTEMEETMDTFSALIRAGKILYLGLSNFAAWQVADTLAICDKRGYIKPVITQNPYSLLFRDIERELLPCLKAHKMGLSVYNPIAAGLLSGKYKNRQLLENTRFSNKKIYYDRYWTDKNFDAVEKLAAIAEGRKLPLLELALRWCISQNGVTSIISGVSKLEQLQQNAQILGGAALDREILDACDKVWKEMEGKTFYYSR